MKAIVVDDRSPARSLHWRETPTPEPGAGEVLVRVRASALNRADLHQRAGNYPPPPGASPILGLELAGEVAALGPGVRGVGVGARVCALVTGGGYAEYAVAPSATLIPIPEGMDFRQAAAVPEAFLTAYTNLFREGAAQPGEVVLVHAGASGVGTAAIQLAARRGCRVFATASSRAKAAACEALGAERGVAYEHEDFAEVLPTRPGFEGVDVVFDMVGRDYLQRNLDLLRWRGRLVFVSLQSGSEACLDLRVLMRKRLALVGTTLRQRDLAEKRSLRDGFVRDFGDDLASGAVRPILDAVFPIEQAERAHERMRENRNVGKIVLEVG